jgi:hypothetical protein
LVAPGSQGRRAGGCRRDSCSKIACRLGLRGQGVAGTCCPQLVFQRMLRMAAWMARPASRQAGQQVGTHANLTCCTAGCRPTCPGGRLPSSCPPPHQWG